MSVVTKVSTRTRRTTLDFWVDSPQNRGTTVRYTAANNGSWFSMFRKAVQGNRAQFTAVSCTLIYTIRTSLQSETRRVTTFEVRPKTALKTCGAKISEHLQMSSFLILPRIVTFFSSTDYITY